MIRLLQLVPVTSDLNLTRKTKLRSQSLRIRSGLTISNLIKTSEVGNLTDDAPRSDDEPEPQSDVNPDLVDELDKPEDSHKGTASQN